MCRFYSVLLWFVSFVYRISALRTTYKRTIFVFVHFVVHTTHTVVFRIPLFNCLSYDRHHANTNSSRDYVFRILHKRRDEMSLLHSFTIACSYCVMESWFENVFNASTCICYSVETPQINSNVLIMLENQVWNEMFQFLWYFQRMLSIFVMRTTSTSTQCCLKIEIATYTLTLILSCYVRATWIL